MIAAVGWTGAVLGFGSSLALAVLGLWAQQHPDRISRGRLRAAVAGMVAGAVAAMGALEMALLTDDFSVAYVAENHARATPLLFTITSAWSALAGSIVLWVLVLAGYTAVVLRGVRDTTDRLGTGALGVMGLVGAFFFGLVATAANPFRVLANPPGDGPGPNPLLQDHILVAFHPPMLYLGFVGFTVPFAFAVSALLCRQGGVEWLRRTRRSSLVAWCSLTGGLVLGAWWSYEVLGWGGYWAWDPVENAALVPWLVATAFLHSAVVQVRRGMLQAWNFVLVLAAFALTILGTFLTRSGVVVSVHSFTQSAVGPVLLGFFVVVVGGGFLLFAARGAHLATGRRPETLASREGAFLVNNLLLTLFAFVVLLGTVYPVFVEAFTGNQVSVGRPFFDRMAVPLSFALLLAMGVGPVTPYRRATGAVLWRRLRLPVQVAAGVAAALVAIGIRQAGIVAAVFLATLITAAGLRQLAVTTPAKTPAAVLRMVCRQRGFWGGQLAHVGVALVVVAIAVSSGLAQRTTVSLTRGQSTTFAGYTLTYQGTREHQWPDRTLTAARIVFRQDGRIVRVAEPGLGRYRSQVQAVATPSVWTTPTRDIYVALSHLDSRSVTVNLYRYPLMWLLWAGGLLVAVGGLWALTGRTGRRRRDAIPAGAGSDTPARETVDV